MIESKRQRGSRMKELLSEKNTAETDSAIVDANVLKTGGENRLSFNAFVVKTNRYEYPRIGRVPATYYRSKIVDMGVREKNGKVILDVRYDLEDSYGRAYHILQSYPADSQPYHRFVDALVAAGVPEGATVDAGIGTEEILELDFVNKNSDLGSIVNRRPYTVPMADDEEEDDVLMDDDE